MPDDIIYGFDSFEGIPEAWIEYKIDGTKSGREFYPKNGMTLEMNNATSGSIFTGKVYSYSTNQIVKNIIDFNMIMVHF